MVGFAVVSVALDSGFGEKVEGFLDSLSCCSDGYLAHLGYDSLPN